MIRAALALCRVIDLINATVGRGVRWVTLALVLLQFGVVVLRYVFSTSFVAAQEGVIYLHAAIFMLGGGYALLRDDHVRVDVLYGPASPRRKAAIDLLGVVAFLIPACVAILVFTWGFVASSWAIREGPMNVGGIPALYLLKALIPAFALLVLLQGVAMGFRALCALVAGGEYPPPRSPPEGV
jgi:TRAP-type mannitol/chloroaromatic compound transport system permease small subunit